MYDFVQNRIEKACLMHHILKKKKKQHALQTDRRIWSFDSMERSFPCKMQDQNIHVKLCKTTMESLKLDE
jgi:hypothetical protein